MNSLAKFFVLGLLLGLFGAHAFAQPLTSEGEDPGARRLQAKYHEQLRAMGAAIDNHHFPYRFALSRTLDIAEKDQDKVDQQSIRFERYDGQLVLAITANYFAAYSSDLMNRNERAKKTFEDVVAPILQATVPPLAQDDTFDGFAIEIAQHVRKKILGVRTENAENLMFYFPRAAALQAARAKSAESTQVAILDSKIYLNSEPLHLWLSDNLRQDEPELLQAAGALDRHPEPAKPAAALDLAVSQKLLRPETPARLITPKTIDDLAAKYATPIEVAEHELRAHIELVPYVRSQFVGFHQGAYLQLSIQLHPPTLANRSRYQVAALTFDDDIAPLLRPTLSHFEHADDFDGLLFSAIVRPQDQGPSLALEYYLPLSALRAYARYDLTGQALLDSGFLLINGDPAQLNLQFAESR